MVVGQGPTGIVLYVRTVVYSWYGLKSPPKKHKYSTQIFCAVFFYQLEPFSAKYQHARILCVESRSPCEIRV